MSEGSFNSESSSPSKLDTSPNSITPTASAEPAALEHMLELRKNFFNTLHKKGPVSEEEADTLLAEIDTYIQNPYTGPIPKGALEEAEKPSVKPGLIKSLRRKLRI